MKDETDALRTWAKGRPEAGMIGWDCLDGQGAEVDRLSRGQLNRAGKAFVL